jgi:predicted metal-dependent hydrolase
MAVTNKMQVRNVKFNFDDIKEVHYIGSNVFATHFLNALHVIFPEGEKLFIRSVKNFYTEIKDPELKAQMRDFMSQEAIHHREHERFWEQLEEMGLNPRKFAAFFKKWMDRLERMIFLILPKRTAQKLMLSMTAGMEHYTALFGNQALGNVMFVQNLYPKEMLMLMLWHSAEELEHKSVAYDVLQKIDSSYFLRVIGMVLASMLFYFFALAGLVYFVYQDKQRDLSHWPSKLKDFFVNFGARPKGAAGWRLLFDYFRPSFHPDDHDNYHLAQDFFRDYKEYFDPKEVQVKAS